MGGIIGGGSRGSPLPRLRPAGARSCELTERRRMLRPVKVSVEDVNAFLCGWAAYFRFGNSAHRFDQISSYAHLGGHRHGFARRLIRTACDEPGRP
ncbi:group II intron maturase-specific domain-containing protein [Streptomyces mirabilis]|uniref:group II intron maturase-specific domain-containing protein n=1 Tax=Streptomyces mirabilis TaxID=68239 RepID=UPI00332ADF51